MSVYAKRVKSKTLKGGVDATLGPCTLIYGPNASKKSAIVNAIELAYTGRISDWRGRNVVAEPAALKSLGATPSGASPADEAIDPDEPASRKTPKVELDLTTLDGASTLRIVSASKSAPFPDAILLRDVEEAVAGSAATLRKFLVRHAIGSVTREDVLARLPLVQRANYTDACAASAFDVDSAEGEGDGASGSAELDLLVSVIGYCGKRTRKAQADAKACTVLINAAPQGTRPDADAFKAAGKKITDAQTALEKRIADAAHAGAVASAAVTRRNKRQALSKRIDELVKEHPAFASAPTPIGAAAPVPFTATFERNLASLRQHVHDNAEKCLVCGGGKSHDDFATRLKLVEAKIAEREFHLLSAQLRELNELFKVDDKPGGAIDPEGTALARRLVDEARAEEAQLAQNKAAWEAVDSARAREGECQALATKFADLGKACGEVMKALFSAGRARFVEKVQNAMPKGARFGLELTETRIDFGLVDSEGELQTALSGAEWVKVMGAVALAIAEGASGAAGGAQGDTPKILIPPDRFLDPQTLTDLMEAWKDFPRRAGVQVVICAAGAPSKFVEGWTLIKTGDLALTVDAQEAIKAAQIAPRVREPRAGVAIDGVL